MLVYSSHAYPSINFLPPPAFASPWYLPLGGGGACRGYGGWWSLGGSRLAFCHGRVSGGAAGFHWVRVGVLGCRGGCSAQEAVAGGGGVVVKKQPSPLKECKVGGDKVDYGEQADDEDAVMMVVGG